MSSIPSQIPGAVPAIAPLADAAPAQTDATSAPATSFDATSPRGSAGALGLPMPRNIGDVEMLFAQVSTELDSSRNSTQEGADASRLANQRGALDAAANTQLGSDPETGAPEPFFDFLQRLGANILSALFNIRVESATEAVAAGTVVDSAGEVAGSAVQENAAVLERLVDRDLVRDIVNQNLPVEAGSPDTVVDRANGLAMAVLTIDAALQQLASTEAPFGMAPDSPAVQNDGRVRLAM